MGEAPQWGQCNNVQGLTICRLARETDSMGVKYTSGSPDRRIVPSAETLLSTGGQGKPLAAAQKGGQSQTRSDCEGVGCLPAGTHHITGPPHIVLHGQQQQFSTAIAQSSAAATPASSSGCCVQRTARYGLPTTLEPLASRLHASMQGRTYLQRSSRRRG